MVASALCLDTLSDGLLFVTFHASFSSCGTVCTKECRFTGLSVACSSMLSFSGLLFSQTAFIREKRSEVWRLLPAWYTTLKSNSKNLRRHFVNCLVRSVKLIVYLKASCSLCTLRNSLQDTGGKGVRTLLLPFICFALYQISVWCRWVNETNRRWTLFCRPTVFARGRSQLGHWKCLYLPWRDYKGVIAMFSVMS